MTIFNRDLLYLFYIRITAQAMTIQAFCRRTEIRPPKSQRPSSKTASALKNPPLRPLRGLQETRVATREESGVLGFPSRFFCLSKDGYLIPASALDAERLQYNTAAPAQVSAEGMSQT